MHGYDDLMTICIHLKVIDVQELLIPVKEKAQKALIEEAKQEAETTTINTLTAEIMAQQAHNQKGATL